MISFESDHNPGRLTKNEIISLLKEKPNEPESREAFSKWAYQAQIEANTSGSKYSRLIFDIELTDVYIEIGMIDMATGKLEDVSYVFENEMSRFAEDEIPEELLKLHEKFISLGLKIYG